MTAFVGVYDPRWPHILKQELVCGRGECREAGIIHGQLYPPTADMFERLREEAGGHPITITSGSRCQAHENELAAGGAHTALHSPHVPVELVGFEGGVFTALDIYCPEVPASVLASIVDRLRPECGIGLWSYLGKFLHFDCADMLNMFWQPGRRW